MIDCDDSKIVNCREKSKWASDGNAFVGEDMKFGSDSKHLGSPFGLFIDTEHGNNIYVADTDNHRVQKFSHASMNSGGITVAGGNRKGNSSDQLSMPRAIYVDKDENIYIADDDNNRIQLWKKGATSGITVAGGFGKGKALNQIGGCHGLFVHEKSKTIYISDFYNDRVVKWSEGSDQGIIVAGTGIGGQDASQLLMPRGISVDQCETIYVADMWNNRIQNGRKEKLKVLQLLEGTEKELIPNQLRDPWDVKVDQYGNVYVADTGNARIVKWMPNQLNGVTVVGGNGYGTQSNQFKDAYGLALDKQGNIFVSERLNHRIQIFKLMTKVILVKGFSSNE